MHILLPTESDTEKLGVALASVLMPPAWVFLEGDLGVGKTALTRAFLQGKGYQARVKSPTYTLVESYALSDQLVYHFDLYRIDSPDALEEIGIRDYEGSNVFGFVEWPEKGVSALPTPTLTIQLKEAELGRVATLTGEMVLLSAILNAFKG